jgi:hypothetical protein
MGKKGLPLRRFYGREMSSTVPGNPGDVNLPVVYFLASGHFSYFPGIRMKVDNPVKGTDKK